MANNRSEVCGAVMVVGGGIAGIQSSLDLAEMGYRVYLVEKSTAIGGTMPSLDKTFPTNDCSMCILSPKLVECGRHLNIEVITGAELVGLEGEAGNFEAEVLKKPRYIDLEKCTGCGECVQVCPVELPDGFDRGLSKRKAIFKKYAQAYPNAFAIDKTGPAPCRQACPAGVNAQAYVALASKGKFREAAEVVYRDLFMPASIGRICPHPCEDSCTRMQLEGAVSIAAIKRFLGDTQPRPPLALPDSREERVAVVGSGPAGLTAAYELAREGYPVTVFEALPVAGGMLAAGIPDYRLPRQVLNKEISSLSDLGVEIKTNTPLGDGLSIGDIQRQGYRAVLLATGAHESIRLGITGEEGRGVIPGVEFLRRVNLGGDTEIDENVVIIGGGDVAMDAARSAIRLGARKVTVLYRRSRAEMPARDEEVETALAEGVEFRFLTAPVSFLHRDGSLQGVSCMDMDLGEPDSSGRRRPVPREGSEHLVAAGTAIVAVGQKPVVSFLPDDLELTGRGTVSADEITLSTSLPGVFACGEIRTGPGMAIESVADGKEAAVSIIRYLKGEDLKSGRLSRKKQVEEREAPGNEPVMERARPREIDPQERTVDFREYALGLSPEEVREEASRCLGCGPCAECMQCLEICKAGCIDHRQGEERLKIRVGAVILAAGFSEFPADQLKSLGYGTYPNVLTSTQFERVLSASGPFGGHLVRPSDGREPSKIAWIQCAGSRTLKDDKPYCSSVCCMYAIKEAVIAREHSTRPLDTAIFYIDMRSYGKDFEKYYVRAQDQGVRFVRSRIFNLEEIRETGNILIRYAREDGSVASEEFDLAVLSVGLCAAEGSEQLALAAGLALNQYGFAETKGFNPVASSRAGVLVAGAFSGPKDIPETVIQASAAASAAAEILAGAKNSLVRKGTYPPEKDVAGRKPRIGVFICHCGINISSVVDVKRVSGAAWSMANVVHVEDNMYTCSQDTQVRIREIIQEKRLNRVVVASCSPRTHEPLFRETMKEAGLNPYLFEMANIRDQCSWVHLHQPEEATEKAVDLVRMAVAKARLLEPVYPVAVPVVKRALVIGAGAAGMTAALAISSQGHPVVLVEKESCMGGMASRLHFNHLGEPVKDFLNELQARVLNDPLISVCLESEICDIRGFIGNFRTTVKTAGEAVELDHGVVVVATGAAEYKPVEYQYGRSPLVRTSLELESLIAEEAGILKDMDTLVLINCVGSRNQEHPYCSRVCCTQSVQLALKAREINPGLIVYVLYRDMRTYGFLEEYYRLARRRGIVFIRYEAEDPPRVRMEGDRVVVACRDHVLDCELEIPADLVGLAAAVVPGGNQALARALKVPLNEDGFFLEAHMKLRPVDFSTDGVYVCGLAHAPKNLAESMAQAAAAAARACTVLNRESIQAGGLTARVNESWCSGCGTCQSVCPSGAIEVDNDKKVAVVNQTLCKGCGACAASCRPGAVDVSGFRSRQIMAMLKQIG